MTKSDKKKESNQHIYLNIDHLKKGTYSLNILDKDKVVKSIKIKKQ